MANDLTLAARLQLDSQRWVQGLGSAQSRTRGFVSGIKREFADLRSFASSTAGALASIGAGYAVGATIAKSASLDRDLEQVRQIAKATADQTDALRKRVFELGKAYGVATEQAHEGFRGLVAGGLSWEEANTALGAMSEAVAVTKSSYSELGSAMQSAAANFNVDLGDLRETTKLINEMAAAADAGSAEIGNLSAIFGSLGALPANVGMTRQRTMAYVEAMAGSVEVGNLGTRVKSTMMLFDNQSYMKEATKATGVKFYEKGVRRDDIEVLKDLRAVIQAQGTQQKRDAMVFKAFGKADVDMQQGIKFFTTLPGKIERLQAIDSVINKASISGIAERVPAAINNAVDSAIRLKNTLGQAGDSFAQPINAAITRLIRYAVDSKAQGGLDLSGQAMLAGGAGALVLAFLGRKLPGKLGSMLGGGASLGAGVAMGTALEKAGAASPVFIVGAAPGVFATGGAGALGNAAAGGVLGTSLARRAPWLARLALFGGSSVGSLAGAGAAGAGALAAGAGVAGVAGYGVGTAINRTLIEGTPLADAIGKAIHQTLAAMGSELSREALESNRKLEVSIMLDDLRSKVTGIRVNGKDATATAGIGRRAPNLGRMLSSPGIY